MHLIQFLAVVAPLLSCVVAFPHGLLSVGAFHGPKVPNSYIVTLKHNVSQLDHLNWFSKMASKAPFISHGWDPSVLNGFAGVLSENDLNVLRSSPDVASIEENGIVHTAATISTQTNAPWGLYRISHKVKPSDQNDSDLKFTYKYDSRAGQGVNIYVVDTGVNTAHTDFGGRAKWGATFGGYASKDGNGHGTHVAGIAAGSRYGVSKKANIIAVKVLADDGSGTLADVISGLNWVIKEYKASKKPSVINLSLGGSPSTALDTAATNAVTAGIHVAVAAGNDNTDASGTSPARAPKVNTVGATGINDARAYFSNYGSVVDIFAPGLDVTSDWIGSTKATYTLSGTSMATPHISGLIAYVISLNGNMSPASMTSKLQSLGQDKKLSQIPSGTRNELAYNGDGL